MVELSKYWNILIISDRGYESREIMTARVYFEGLFTESQLLTLDDRNIQRRLLDIFINSDNQADKINAGLCLRCCISYGIVRASQTLVRQFCTENSFAVRDTLGVVLQDDECENIILNDDCQTLLNQFNTQYSFTIRDILGVVLQDDGRERIILDEDGQTQILIDNNGQQIILDFPRFAIQIIARFDPDRSGLENWAYYRTRHNDDLTEHLRLEYGLLLATNWAILNRVRRRQMQGKSEENQHIINVYHQVYRSDRLHNRQRGRCPEPCQDQLLRMIDLLNAQGVIINSHEDLLEKLNKLGEYFRELEINPNLMNNDEQNPLDPLQQFLDTHLIRLLDEAIAHTFSKCINELKNSRGYSNMVDKLIPGYGLIYVNKMTLGQVAKNLDFTGQPQASRVLKPEYFITQVGNYMFDQMLQIIRNLVLSRGRNQNPDQIQKISQYVNDYILEKVTLSARNELRSGRRPPERNSLFAERMRTYLSI